MPGLADAHAHLVVTIGAAPDVRARWQAVNERLLLVGLARGVTTAVELGGVGLGPDPDRVLPALRQEIAAGQRLGPTLYLATAKANDSALTRAQGMRVVDSARAGGYDLVKVYNALSREGYRGILLRAQQLGMPVVGHVVRAVGLEGTLGGGQRGIAHAEEYLPTYFPFRVTDTLQVPERVLARPPSRTSPAGPARPACGSRPRWSPPRRWSRRRSASTRCSRGPRCAGSRGRCTTRSGPRA
jgi:hypothetical protein